LKGVLPGQTLRWNLTTEPKRLAFPSPGIAPPGTTPPGPPPFGVTPPGSRHPESHQLPAPHLRLSGERPRRFGASGCGSGWVWMCPGRCQFPHRSGKSRSRSHRSPDRSHRLVFVQPSIERLLELQVVDVQGIPENTTYQSKFGGSLGRAGGRGLCPSRCTNCKSPALRCIRTRPSPAAVGEAVPRARHIGINHGRNRTYR